MEQRPFSPLGRTVSAVGLGGGGRSRLGHRDPAGSPGAVIAEALRLGITYFDTAPRYGTEEVLGEALAGLGEQVVVSTKVTIREGGELISPAGLRASLDESRRRLRRDVLDVVFLHGVRPEEYDAARRLLDELHTLKAGGVVRAVGISESFPRDPSHLMLRRAVADRSVDALLVGMNVLNPSATDLVADAAAMGIGCVVMHATRWALTSSDHLVDHLRTTRDETADDAVRRRVGAAIEAILAAGDAVDLPGDAYRFVAVVPGVTSILVGTGSPAHLAANVEAIETAAELPRYLRAVVGVLADHPRGSGDPVT